jgi:hypothetical protein
MFLPASFVANATRDRYLSHKLQLVSYSMMFTGGLALVLENKEKFYCDKI